MAISRTSLAPLDPRATSATPTAAQLQHSMRALWNHVAYLFQDLDAQNAANVELQDQLMHWPKGFNQNGLPTTAPAAQARSPEPIQIPRAEPETNPDARPATDKQVDFYQDLCRQAGVRVNSSADQWSMSQISTEISSLRNNIAKLRMDRDAEVTDRQIVRYIAECHRTGVAPSPEDELRQTLNRGELADEIDALIAMPKAA